MPVCKSKNSFLAALMIGAAALLAPAKSALSQTPAAKVDFQRDVAPIFAKRCIRCHGAEKQESGYRLDVRQSALEGGDFDEPPIVPGKSAASPLIRFVTGVDPDSVMPPEGPRLTKQEIATLKDWIDQGAEWPRELAGSGAESRGDHWAFQPLRTVAVPPNADPLADHPIDRFVSNRLAGAELRFSPPAERDVLIRRVYLDVLGLVPAPEVVRRFVQDQRQDAYERLIENVLASPNYGERWARHWLDVVRFAETHGFETNRERPNAWPYRDYVIDALNDDKPYDQFVRDQLAGDATGADAATGFLVGGPYDLVKGRTELLGLMQRQNELADMVNTTGTAFLALTLGCARCHSHKFDPVRQSDYYALSAVFAGVEYADRPLSNPEVQPRVETLKRRLAAARKRLDELLPDLRAPVNARLNEERFEPVKARWIRFTVRNTNNGSEPCLDELEVFSAERPGQPARNVALASSGAKATSSGDYAGNPKHKLEHIHDGRYGNDRSWISNQRGRGWVMIELPRPIAIDRIVWGRDRKQGFGDRVPTRYWIEVAVEPGAWREIAGAHDRAPFGTPVERQRNRPASENRRVAAAEARGVFQTIRSIEDQIEKTGERRPSFRRYVSPTGGDASTLPWRPARTARSCLAEHDYRIRRPFSCVGCS